MGGLGRDNARALWGLVTGVGLLVIALVLVLQLIPRLDAGQEVLDDAGPAFTDERVAGDRAGITIVSQIVDLSDPLVTARSGGAAEVPKLVGFVAKETGLSQAAVLGALEREAPRTTALLQSLPLSGVTDELPRLTAFLAKTLEVSPGELGAILQRDFPRLAQTIAALPKVTRGWNDVPGVGASSRFDGSPIKTVPDVRDLFAKDVIPVLERQDANFRDLASTGGVRYVPYLLLTLGGLVTFFGVMMLISTRSGPMSRAEGMTMWGVVAGAGVVVIVLVLGLGLFGRLGGGDELLDDAKPAFTDERVAGDRAGITIVSQIVDMADPIATPEGGAAAEVPKLVAFVARETGLSQPAVRAALDEAAPRTTALLQAIPLSGIADEVPRLVGFLTKTLNISGPALITALDENFPRLKQTIDNVGPVTRGWNDVPGTERLTRFDGTRVETVPDVRAYFADDVVPVLERRKDDFQKLEGTWPPVDVFPALLLVIGIIVTLLGAAMVAAFSGGFVAGPSGRRATGGGASGAEGLPQQTGG